jgi:hypothetical protein
MCLDILSANVALLCEPGLGQGRIRYDERDEQMSDTFHGGGAYIIADQLRQL